MDKNTEIKNPIQVAERIFKVVEYLAAHGATSLTEISTAVGLNKSTVHRILHSLLNMHYVKQDTDTSKYCLTLKLWRIANQALGQVDIIDVAQSYLKRLVAATGETVHLVQLDGTNAVYIHKAEAYQNPVRLVSQVGHSIPLFCSGVGKAMLAQMNTSEIERLWNQSERKAYTANTILDFAVFMKEISFIRMNGFALDREEHEPGISCIAVALNQEAGQSMYAISISAPSTRMQEEQISRLKTKLLQIKTELSNELSS
jgi:DNA-binding IclR family transcriptional regulator